MQVNIPKTLCYMVDAREIKRIRCWYLVGAAATIVAERDCARRSYFGRYRAQRQTNPKVALVDILDASTFGSEYGCYIEHERRSQIDSLVVDWVAGQIGVLSVSS